MNKLVFCGLVALIVSITGCASYPDPIVDGKPFVGIKKLLAAPGEPAKQVDVFLIHGMEYHGSDWAQNSLKALADGFKEKVQPQSGPAVAGIETWTAELSNGVRAVALVWSPLTSRLKQQLCYDQTHKTQPCAIAPPPPSYPWNRASINRDIKDQVIDDGFADVLIYQGDGHRRIKEAIQTALLAARVMTLPGRRWAAPEGLSLKELASASLANNAPLVILSESLGSKMVFDSVWGMLRDPDHREVVQAGAHLYERTEQLFMGANQIPLLMLSQQNNTIYDAAVRNIPGDPLSLLKFFSANRHEPQIVAFSDPNDLFTFALKCYPKKDWEATDVIVSNAVTYIGSGRLAALEDPKPAHTTYLGNPKVMNAIVNGSEGLSAASPGQVCGAGSK